MAKSTDRRQVFLINPKFQINFIAYSFLIGLLASLCSFMMNIYEFHSYEEQGVRLGIPSDHLYFQFIHDQTSRASWTFAIVATTILILTGIYGFYMSHRIAGPIHRLKTYLRETDPHAAQIPELKFRQDDYFQEVADEINDFVKRSRK